MSASPRIATPVSDHSESPSASPDSMPATEHVAKTETEARSAMPVAETLPASPEVEAVLRVVGRLEELLREETAGLRGASIESLKAMNHRKSQCLLELTRAARALGNQPPHPRLTAGLERLAGVITENQNALSTHFEAVREIAGIIAETMRAHESDGTYADRPAPQTALGQTALGQAAFVQESRGNAGPAEAAPARSGSAGR